jgi:hypothetical protein
MSSENEAGALTFPAGQGPHQITAARVEKGTPESYRLVRYRADDGAIELKLQGCYLWFQGSDAGYEWRDIPTVDLTETQP